MPSGTARRSRIDSARSSDCTCPPGAAVLRAPILPPEPLPQSRVLTPVWTICTPPGPRPCAALLPACRPRCRAQQHRGRGLRLSAEHFSDHCSHFVVAYSIYDEWYHFDSTLLLIIFPIYSTMWNCIPLFLTTKTEGWHARSEEHTSELQSLMRISYAVFC